MTSKKRMDGAKGESYDGYRSRLVWSWRRRRLHFPSETRSHESVHNISEGHHAAIPGAESGI